MADDRKLTDSEIVAEFKLHGESIQLPINHKKRPLLLKKLNHLRAKKNNQESKNAKYSKAKTPASSYGNNNDVDHSLETETSSPSRSPYFYSDGLTLTRPLDSSVGQDVLSDDSDFENGSNSSFRYKYGSKNAKYQYDLDHNTEVHDWQEPSRGYTAGKRWSSYLPSNVEKAVSVRHRPATAHRDVQDDEADVIKAPPKTSKLYPDIASFFSGTEGKKESFESSDSDIDNTESVGSKPYVKSNPIYHETAKYSLKNIPPPKYNRRSGTSPKTKLNREHPNKSILPTILFGIAIIIVIALASTYLILQNGFESSWFSFSSNMARITGSGDRLLVCKDDTETQDCCKKVVIDEALKFLDVLFLDLSSRKGQVLCGTAVAGYDFIQVADLKTYIGKNVTDDTSKDGLIDCSLIHILANPHWNIRALQDDDSPAVLLRNMAKLKSDIPSMSFLCRLRRAFSTVLSVACLVTIAVGLLILVAMYLKYRRSHKEAEQLEVYEMVERIIEVLQDHYEQTKGEESDELPYLAVQHVRDLLLPPSRRHNLQPIWDKAVSFIDANESRIRMETRLIHGDEFVVWCWLQSAVLIDKALKVKALGKTSGSRRSDHNVDSPCLKISNVFCIDVEMDDSWNDTMIEVILERCAHVDSIVHVAIDDDSVFVKCSSCEAAGQARAALHDWCFDGQKLIVSPLDTDYYHKKWPEARYATRPLKA